ncbi:MAG TPA: ABATE domain-containing protein [Gemmatimonadaceae bacterium]|jgi:predicted RNA-binding Zn ribbon-like protein|nr:ABATE domain-containing protein [Gemmatimonadaceae bacterium]
MVETLPAPVFLAGQSWLDFVNTAYLDRGQPVELLPDVEHLIDWLVAAGLLDRAEAARARAGRHGAALLDEALEVRRTLRELAEWLIDGHRTVPVRARTTINRVLAARSGYPQVVGERRLEQRVVTTITQPIGILAGVAQSAADLLTHGDYGLVKQCVGPTCVTVFYDTTKNHARRFCSAAVCGNRFKAAARYRRLKGERD